MKGRTLFAALLGAITVAGFAPLEWFPLPLLTLAGLFVLWRQAGSGRQAALLGLAWGLGCFLTGVSWVYVSLHDVGGMAAPLAAVATLAFCAVLALFPALVGYGYFRLRSNRPLPDALLLAGLWALGEWLRGWIFTGFPWLALGYSQTPPSPLAGFAPILGVYGIGGILALMAALLAAWFGRRDISISPRPVLLILLAFLVGGSLLRLVSWSHPVGSPLEVALLQGNVPQSLKWNPEQLPLSLKRYGDLAIGHPAQLTVLPETAIPLFFDQIPADYLRALAGQGELLLGAALRQADGGYVNGAVALGPDRGIQTYAKRHLVPFGEYVPPGFAWFFQLVRIPLSDFSAGPERQPPLSIAGQKVAPNICYEDLFGEEILKALPEATLLINLSNTAWFGDSLAQPQHLQIARLRALETARPMLRATNTGMTAAVAPDGRVTQALPAFRSDALRVSVQGHAGITPYVRHGNKAALGLALLACWPAWRLGRRSRKPKSP
ncbi:apolipoprotein N-acyltransferase [Denitratisoma oestradiolicum]|uniref:Apolipoprotein N-acyltransferase n=1 Tax=Denitratisoma oestradiolicum TaxID=311182 RepID=A0A6S6XRY6_9PROT|nr:apolipoprotein N-acyltransferase [Denitratisoma oestradiolicum]TWO79722.1 apolipoprotein N-acyltransferase [Denitratisoma oestradiolicum]CAB1367485.1 Apolipoprotein N-acyltransferase [Denitratisoma oestradiolicum]